MHTVTSSSLYNLFNHFLKVFFPSSLNTASVTLVSSIFTMNRLRLYSIFTIKLRPLSSTIFTPTRVVSVMGFIENAL